MREATLYTIQEQRVVVHNRDYVSFHRMAAPHLMWTDDNVNVLEPIKRIDAPVKHIVKVTDGVRKDDFIAIDPDLREMVEAPLKREHGEHMDMLRKQIQILTWDVEWYRLRVKGYNELPWYKRIWRKP
jgi:hypothetical protein